MRNKKKLVSIMLAVLMLLTVCGPAFTETVEAYSITINNDVDGYTYVAYQIFKGDYADGILSNIEWGDGVNSASLLSAIVSANSDSSSALYGLFPSITTSSSASDVASILASTSFSDNSSSTIAFAELVAQYVDSTAEISIPYDSTSGTYTVDGLDSGYYLVMNTAVPDEDNTAYSRYMIRVVGDADVNPKSGVPTSSKTVDDVNDSTGASTTTTTTADYDIGDDVSFTLTGEVPSYYGGYSSYTMIFHDMLSSGLSFNSDSVVVTIDGVTVPATTTVNGATYTNYVINYTGSALSDGCTFEVEITDLKALYDTNGDLITVTASSKVAVTYTAELLDTATFEETNTMYLEYSNSPYDASSTGTTPEDVVTVFTYSLVITKAGNTTGNALNGATFALYKYDLDSGEYVLVEEIDGTSTNVFTFNGLDDGQYKLVETVTPAGYNTMDDLYFKIEATHTEDVTTGVASVTALTVTQTDENGTGVSTVTQTFNTTSAATTGQITATVINHSGSGLPLTGSIGTTMIYIIGGIACVLAVLLTVRKRMRTR